MSSMQLSERVQRVKPSATIAISTLAREMRAEGRDVLSLSAGEPDFDTPEHVRAAAAAAMEAGDTRYTAADGTPELKRAICSKFKRDNQLEFEPSQISVGAGAKQVLFNASAALLNPGDEAIILAPYWVSYPDIVKLCDGTPVIVSADIDSGYKVTPEQVESAITGRTRMIFLNTPGNPTGVSYTRAELEALGEVLGAHERVVVVSDDIYEHIYWGDEPWLTPAQLWTSMRDRIITVNGVSKAYAMTGWRIGYAGANAALVGAMRKLCSQTTANPCSISQAAAAAALDGDQSMLEAMRKAFKERYDYLHQAISATPGMRCARAQGAFYLFVDAREAIRAKGLANDAELAELILSEAEVALVPGSAFGAEGHLRFSFACGMDDLEEAARRLRRLLA
ncbi:MAG: pyridoxal phosphate-dependent aminotransferase [Gammaproteobacteria bacterium]|nr:pyridoxal phosphate-dependent aminotransferase [Gammaproteobacteria bacterium]MCY4256459.1 pyridoxal phosphate-dependent aminotransferase [Gammaproteobacteria bacterium]